MKGLKRSSVGRWSIKSVVWWLIFRNLTAQEGSKATKMPFRCPKLNHISPILEDGFSLFLLCFSPLKMFQPSLLTPPPSFLYHYISGLIMMR